MTEVSARLALEPDGQQRLDALRSQDEAFLEASPASKIVSSIRRKVHLADVTEAHKARQQRVRWTLFLGAPMAVAAATLMAIQTPMSSPEPVDTKGYEAPKGDLTDLRLYLKEDGGTVSLASGQALAEGDIVQITTLSRAHAHGVVVSVDGRGAVTLHHPNNTNGNTDLDTDGEHPLPNGYQLDDAPSVERFFLVVGDAPIDPSLVKAAARQLAQDGTASDSELELPDTLTQTSFLLVKVDR